MTIINTTIDVEVNDYEVEIDVELSDVLENETVENVLDEMCPDAEELLLWICNNDRKAIARCVLANDDVRTDIINALLEHTDPTERLEWVEALEGDTQKKNDLPSVTFTPVEGLLNTVWRVQTNGKDVGITIDAGDDHQVRIWGDENDAMELSGLIQCKNKMTAWLIAEALVTNNALRL